MVIKTLRPQKISFFRLHQLIVQPVVATKTPPIQRPVMVSSILSQRESPTPPKTAAVQMGQNALAEEIVKAVKIAKSLKIYFCKLLSF